MNESRAYCPFCRIWTATKAKKFVRHFYYHESGREICWGSETSVEVRSHAI
jgi:hypothetical protein